jgi:hypothetical protein
MGGTSIHVGDRWRRAKEDVPGRVVPGEIVEALLREQEERLELAAPQLLAGPPDARVELAVVERPDPRPVRPIAGVGRHRLLG